MNEETQLSQKIFNHIEDVLLIHLRFMEPAFTRVNYEPVDALFPYIDGQNIYADPHYVVGAFAQNPSELMRNYLHMVLHCVFKHVFSGPTLQAPLWDLACDVAVEACINDLHLDELYVPRVEGQQSFLAELSDNMPYITAEAVYSYLVETGVDARQAVALRSDFFVDDHSQWIRGSKVQQPQQEQDTEETTNSAPHQTGNSVDEHSSESDDNQDAPAFQGKTGKTEGEEKTPDVTDDFQLVQDALAQELAESAGSDKARTISDPRKGKPDFDWKDHPIVSDEFIRDMQTQWREIALRMDVALDDFKHMWGMHGGDFSTALKLSNVEHIDYRDFLLRFASRGEQLSINDDEFDYVYYCYGLSLYGNVPLIEPLEYTDDQRISDFVIAIDTSASTRGDMVRHFLERTYDILHESKTFASRMNLYLIQCDARLQDVAHIESQNDMDTYLANIEIKGLGGTDFRPVFAFVDDLVLSGQLSNLQGMLYFTDGQGTYPKDTPSYDVAFVIPDTANHINPDVPPWAIRVNVDASDLGMEGF